MRLKIPMPLNRVNPAPRSPAISLGFALALLTVYGCASATPVTDEPLEAAQEEELECLLVGTWYHEYSDGTALPEPAQNIYHLEEDGTGRIEPNEGSQEMGMSDTITELDWRLDGRNLHMDRADGQEDVFRVDDWSPEAMDWFFYANSMEYGVGREEGEDLPSC